jgi:hypothetical protein
MLEILERHRRRRYSILMFVNDLKHFGTVKWYINFNLSNER